MSRKLALIVTAACLTAAIGVLVYLSFIKEDDSYEYIPTTPAGEYIKLTEENISYFRGMDPQDIARHGTKICDALKMEDRTFSRTDLGTLAVAMTKKYSQFSVDESAILMYASTKFLCPEVLRSP